MVCPWPRTRPWTWVDRSNNSIKSCLDLGIVSAGLVPFVNTFNVDKEQEFTPMRVRRTKKGVTSSYSDHFSVEVIFKGLQRAGRMEQEEEEETCTWNLRKLGGWEEYENQTNMVASQLERIVEDDHISIDECMRKIDNLNNKVKFTAFGKTRITQAKKKLITKRVCSECHRLEGGPESAKELDQQRSMALMISVREEVKGRPGLPVKDTKKD